MNDVACVVFDLDDTVYLERDYVRSGFEAVGKWVIEHLGIDDFGPRAWRAFEEGSRGHVFDEALERCGVEASPGLVAKLVDVYRNHEPAIEMLPDASRAVSRLGAHGHLLAVVTGGPGASQRTKARALEVERWTRVAVFTAELGEKFAKPHPRAFEHVEQRSGCKGPACAYVADNPAVDFAGPRLLGWRTIRVRRPDSLHAAVPSGSDVDLEVSDLDRLDDDLRIVIS